MKNSLVWFQNDLRIQDNTSLTHACEASDQVIGVYCFDPRHFFEGDFGFVKTGKFRAKFLLESVRNLQEQLTSLNISLLVHLGKPEEVVPSIVDEYKISNFFFQKEWTRDERIVRESLLSALPDSVNIQTYYDQFLFHPEEIPFDNAKDIPMVFTAFRKKLEKYAAVRKPLPAPKSLPTSNLLAKESKIPSLEDLGHSQYKMDERTAFPFKGGEINAWERLDHYFWQTEQLKEYKQTRNGLVGTDYSSKFSPWLANGCISARSIYAEVRNFEKTVHKNSSTYWMIFELIWRDFFKYISLKFGDNIFHLGGILKKEYEWKSDPEILKQWTEGRTKYDFVNANMKELAAMGWMSNRGRQNVASFWAKEMEQDWRIGASYFESLLVDYDVHSNWGNWMYNAGVGNDPRDRKFNIERQAEMYDSDHRFRNLWNQ
ncbi:DASH family cryptochrome [Aureitalea sp. L0-47]|uniref:DASH family cryptochrome n=1 Tax=Aureitalea sp. L0-47 TaxID=2816962 RepID=UPI002237AB69|nr:DASH family cryptochrome [Aureitalea sp. L0-47]MCW5519331.1 DASH family cryptochrome [Aureitalea sp. L0-47]